MVRVRGNCSSFGLFLRVFPLLMWKNFLVRRRCWISAIVQILLTVLLAYSFSETLDHKPAEHNKYEASKENINSKLHSPHLCDYTYYYAPKNVDTTNIMQSVHSCLHLKKELEGFETEKKALDALNKNASSDARFHGETILITFTSSPNSKKLDYSIRTERSLPSKFNYESRYRFERMTPVSQLQHCLNMEFIRNKIENPTFSANIFTQEMPSAPVDESETARIVFVGLAVVFFLPAFFEVKFVSDENRLGVNVLMAMNGVKTRWNYFSWLLSSLLFSFLYTIPAMIFLTVKTNIQPLFYHSSPLLILIIFTLNMAYNSACITHLTSYISQPVINKLFLIAVYGFGAAIKFIPALKGPGAPFLGLIFPNVLLVRAFEEAHILEIKSIGVQWTNIFEIQDDYYKVTTFGLMMIFLVFGTIFHFTMSVYIQAIAPGKYGVKKNLLYFLEACRGKKNDASPRITPVEYEDQMAFESVPDSARPGISVRNLKKTYQTSFFDKSATVDALKDISLDLYHGQITALLGQNGAGKSTMMSIITGMASPTSGNVLVNGKDLSTEMDTIISDIGFCPQENICFPQLTIREQLLFFGLLKRQFKSKKQVGKDVDHLLNKLGLTPKKNCLQSSLSGGQKRRACLAMALISDASTVILDEPTSGLDPENRRHIWDIILGARKGKTILISTHSMDEADILGDRVAIIDSGILQCYGTPMFLKKSYGQGKMEITCSTTESCNAERVWFLFGDTAEITSVDNGRLKLAVSQTPDLPTKLDQLESEKEHLGVTGISVSAITLEEVLIRVVEKNKEHEPEEVSEENRQYQKVTGIRLTLQRITALIKNKIIFNQKHPLSMIVSLLLVALGWFLVLQKTETDLKQVLLDPTLYEKPQTFNTRNIKGFSFHENYPSFIYEHLEYPNTKNSNRLDLIKDLEQMAEKYGSEYTHHAIAGADFEESGNNVSATALYFEPASYSYPISLNLVYNAILKTLAGKDYEITTSLEPLPMFNSAPNHAAKIIMDFVFFGYCSLVFIIFSLFVIHPHRENITQVKNLQIMTGTSAVTYWMTIFVFDLFAVLVLSSIFVISLGINAGHSGPYEVKLIFLLLFIFVLFAANALPLAYSMSFFKSLGSIFSFLSIGPTILIFVEMIITALMISFLNPNLVYLWLKVSKWIFSLVPHMTFYKSIKKFAGIAFENVECRKLPMRQGSLYQSQENPGYHCAWECIDSKCKMNPATIPFFGKFESESLEECLLILICTSVLYFFVLFTVEKKLIQKMFANKNMQVTLEQVDAQVKAEKMEVAEEINQLNQQKSHFVVPKSNTTFLAYELRKCFGKLQAVKDISFKLQAKECFGLLGVNGAGKSTTFKMINGQEIRNNGSLFLNGKSIKTEEAEYFSNMGYCPQHSALLDKFNAEHHLRLFARLRGIPEQMVEYEVQKWIAYLGLQKLAKKPAGTYSGGNKRRLSCAIAMIGCPKVILLDEPTTGVDPASRKFLWKVIVANQRNGQSIILTSHSMEECETLCNRLGIMVDGQFVCIGASEQLKQKFGTGFDIQLKLKPDLNDQVNDLKTDIIHKLNCEVTYEYTSVITCHVKDKQSWRYMYEVLYELQQNYDVIEDFTILSSTLEQLFLQFARGAENAVKNSV